MAYTGRCNCGAVTAQITGKTVGVRRCWCRQCQKAAAGSATTNAIFETDNVAVDGELGSWGYVAPSGNTLTQSFCRQCGTPIMAQSSARPQFRTVRIGFLDEPHDLKPQMAIWMDEKPDWAVEDETLETVARQPPPPAPAPED